LKRSQTQYPPIKKRDGSWTRSEEKKAEIFVMHFSKVFKPNPREIILEEENKLLSDDITFATPDTPTRLFIIKEVRTVIKNLNAKKAPDYDLIIKHCRSCQKWE
jgi:hypothetical protein